LEIVERKIELRRHLNNTFVTAYSNALATHGYVTLISLSSLHNVDNGVEMMERGIHFLNHLCRSSSGSTHATTLKNDFLHLPQWIITIWKEAAINHLRKAHNCSIIYSARTIKLLMKLTI